MVCLFYLVPERQIVKSASDGEKVRGEGFALSTFVFLICEPNNSIRFILLTTMVSHSFNAYYYCKYRGLMRSYILTELERQHLLRYLESLEASDDFYVLLNRINKNYDKLNEDMKLIKMVLKKRDIQK